MIGQVRPRAAVAPPRAWPRWPLLALLALLFLGPLIAPLFQATRLPLLADSGALARDLLSHYVCPTPAKSYVLLGFPMAVCARCWGATVGLWLAWLLTTGAGPAAWRARLARPLAAYRAAPWALRLAMTIPPFLLWTLEINAWPAAPRALLLLNGAHAGLWAGLLLYSTWPGLLPRPAAE